MTKMSKVLFLFAFLLFGCTGDKAPKYPFQAEVLQSNFKPISADMDYAPEGGLTWVNFDPNQVNPVALGYLLTHTTNDLVMSARLREAMTIVMGSENDRMVRFGFLPTPFGYQKNAVIRGLSLNETIFEQNGKKYVAGNCMSCHGGMFGNLVVGGAPNKDFDPEAWFSLIQTSMRFEVDDTTTASKSYVDNVVRKIFSPETDQTVGAQAPTFVVFSTFAHLRDYGRSYDDWELPGKSPAFAHMMKIIDEKYDGRVPLHHARPWWSARYSGNHFRLGVTIHGVDNSAADLALDLATPNYGSPVTNNWDSRYQISRQLQEYMDEIRSPDFPGQIDKTAAAAGQGLYNESCGGCHGAIVSTGPGSYRLDYNQEAAWTTQTTLQTDQRYWNLNADLEFTAEIVHHNADYKKYNARQQVPALGTSSGFFAPPLVGVWAMAPYLHNASIPTLWDLMNPDTRPTIWRLNDDRTAYDYDHVGVAYSTPKTVSDRRTYDTRLLNSGMSNSGHTFGSELSKKEKQEIIEFLKTLTTENVTPNPK